MGGSFKGYTLGQCTAYVAQVLGWVPANLGNAANWLTGAARLGYTTVGSAPGYVPPVGSVAVWGPGQGGAESDGHVAVVQGVTPSGQLQVAEMNWTYGAGVPDTRTVSATTPEGYILPPGTKVAAAAAATAATGSAPSSGGSGVMGSGFSAGSGIGAAAATGLVKVFGSASSGSGLMGKASAALPALVVAAVTAYVLFAPGSLKGVGSRA